MAGEEASNEPDDHNPQVGLGGPGVSACWVDDELMPLQSHKDKERMETVTDIHWIKVDILQKDLAKDPVVHDGVDGRERLADEAHEEVGEARLAMSRLVTLALSFCLTVTHTRQRLPRTPTMVSML